MKKAVVVFANSGVINAFNPFQAQRSERKLSKLLKQIVADYTRPATSKY